MSSSLPSTQRALNAMPALPVHGRKGLAAPGREGLDAVQGLHGNAFRTVTPNPVLNPKRTLNATVIIKVHEVGAP